MSKLGVNKCKTIVFNPVTSINTNILYIKPLLQTILYFSIYLKAKTQVNCFFIAGNTFRQSCSNVGFLANKMTACHTNFYLRFEEKLVKIQAGSESLPVGAAVSLRWLTASDVTSGSDLSQLSQPCCRTRHSLIWAFVWHYSSHLSSGSNLLVSMGVTASDSTQTLPD